jgi:hypothetical protein
MIIQLKGEFPLILDTNRKQQSNVDKRNLKKVISSTFINKEISLIERRFEALDEVNICNIYRNWIPLTRKDSFTCKTLTMKSPRGNLHNRGE